MGCTGSMRKGPEPGDEAFDLATWLKRSTSPGGSADLWHPGVDPCTRPPSDAMTLWPSANASSGGAPAGDAGANPGAAANPDQVSIVVSGSSAHPSPTGDHCGCNPSLLLTLFRGGKSQRARRRPASRRKASPDDQWHWLEDLIGTITSGDASEMAVDLVKQETGTPLFVMAGSCPNTFAGMQAVLFCKMGSGVDFWWIKPQVDDVARLEQNTLNHHAHGRYKNVAESSKAAYGPLAEKFSTGAKGGGLTYGVTRCGRAYIEEETDGVRNRMFLYLISEEDWSGFFALSVYMRGKIYYQKGDKGAPPAPGSSTQFFARQYQLEDREIKLAPLGVHPEEVLSEPYPPQIVPKQ